MAVTTSSTEAINNQTKTGQGGGGGRRAGSSEAHNPKKDRMKWAVRLLSWVPILACLSLCAVLAFRLVSLEAKVEVIQVMTIYGNWYVKLSFYHLVMALFLRKNQRYSLNFVSPVPLARNCKKRLLPKICDWAKYQNRHGSKSIRVTKLSFCQSDSPMSLSFWQKNSLVTHIFFDLCLFKHIGYEFWATDCTYVSLCFRFIFWLVQHLLG